MLIVRAGARRSGTTPTSARVRLRLRAGPVARTLLEIDGVLEVTGHLLLLLLGHIKRFVARCAPLEGVREILLVLLLLRGDYRSSKQRG